MPPRRTPAMIALEILECIENNEETNKWDLIKVLGNEAQHGVWIERFFLPEKLIEEKEKLLSDLVARNGRLFFTHDPGVAMARVLVDERGRYGTGDAWPSCVGV